MTTITFDTLQFVTRLKESGMNEQQATAVVNMQKEVLQDAFDLRDVASKYDVETVKRDIKEAELRLEVKIAETRADLIRWIVGAGFLQTALIAGLLLKMMK